MVKYDRTTRKKPRSQIKTVGTKYEATVRISHLEARVAELEEAKNFLTSALSHMSAKQVNAKPFDLKSSERSTLSMFCEMLDMQTFPENPAEKLRGLLSDLDIEESSTDIIRDVRDNR